MLEDDENMSILSLIWVKIATIATGVLITVGAVNPLSTEPIATSTSFTVTDQVAYIIPIEEKPQVITIYIATSTPVEVKPVVSQETPIIEVPQQVTTPPEPVIEPVKPSCTLKASIIEHDRMGDPYTAQLEWTITGEPGNGRFEYARFYGGDETYEVEGVKYALGFEPLKYPGASVANTATTSKAAYKQFYKLIFKDGTYCVTKTK